MAGDWIKVEMSTPDKPEVWQLADRLGIDPDAVTGKLLRIWAWADTHSEDGNNICVTKALLDRIAGVTGFAESLLHVGWLAEIDGKLTFPNFCRHNGKSAKKRAETARRVADSRKSNAICNTNVVTESEQKALPEKRREEKINNTRESGDSPVPVQQIVDLYNSILSELPAVSKMTDARRQLVKSRWNQDTEHQSLEFWERFFLYTKKSDFLMGRVTGRGDKPFQASFDWILKQSNFVKVYEGNYDNVLS